jgi:hypothetical protein
MGSSLRPKVGSSQGSDALRQRLEQLVEVARVLGKHVAVARHEPIEVVVVASVARRDHLVQVGKHVLDARQILGFDVAHRPGEVLEVGVEDLLLQPVNELLEAAPRLLGCELVVHQLAQPAPGIGGERIEHGLLEPRLVALGRRQLEPLELEDLVELVA